MTFNYNKRFEENKKLTKTQLISELQKNGISKGPNENGQYATLIRLSHGSLAKIITDLEIKKRSGSSRYDQFDVENIGKKEFLINFIHKNNLLKSPKKLTDLSVEYLKSIILSSKKSRSLDSGKSPTKPPCKPGKVRNAAGRCVKAVSPRKSPTKVPKNPCKPGKVKNAAGRCVKAENVKKAGSPRKSPTKAPKNPCKPGKVKNAAGRCVKAENVKKAPIQRKSKSPSRTPSSRSSTRTPSSRSSTRSSMETTTNNWLWKAKEDKAGYNRSSSPRNKVRKFPKTTKRNINDTTCSKCGATVLKILLKKHQESKKCRKKSVLKISPTYVDDDDSPIQIKRRRKIIVDSPESENEIISPKTRINIKSPESDETNIISPKKRISIDDDEESQRIGMKRKITVNSPESDDETMNVKTVFTPQKDNYEEGDEVEEADHEEDEDMKNEEDEEVNENNDDELEEGDEIDEVEEIDDVDDIDSKLFQINNKIKKNDHLIRNTIIRCLGLL